MKNIVKSLILFTFIIGTASAAKLDPKIPFFDTTTSTLTVPIVELGVNGIRNDSAIYPPNQYYSTSLVLLPDGRWRLAHPLESIGCGFSPFDPRCPSQQ